jgi:hypothetical protein
MLRAETDLSVTPETHGQVQASGQRFLTPERQQPRLQGRGKRAGGRPRSLKQRGDDQLMPAPDSNRTNLSYGTVTSEDGFAALEPGWDRLVRAMPHASPFLLHGWLSAWLRHGARGAEPRVQVARQDGQLVAALPLCVGRRRGLRVTRLACAGAVRRPRLGYCTSPPVSSARSRTRSATRPESMSAR